MSATVIRYEKGKEKEIDKALDMHLKSNKWKQIGIGKYGKGFLAIIKRKIASRNEIAVFALHSLGAQVSSRFSLWGLGLFSITVRKVIRDICTIIEETDKELDLDIFITKEHFSLK